MKVFGLGLALTAVITTIEYLAWGGPAVVPAVSFGLLASGIQVVAVRSLRKAIGAPFSELIKRWSVGMGLRLGGVVLFVAAVVLDRTLFPPLPTAFGYLGVVIPLLFAEPKLAQ